MYADSNESCQNRLEWLEILEMLWSVIRLIFKTSSVTPDFFYVFNLILSFSTCRQSFKKTCAWEILGANILRRDVIEYLIWSEAFNYSISEHRPLTKSLQSPLSLDRRSSWCQERPLDWMTWSVFLLQLSLGLPLHLLPCRFQRRACQAMQ